MSKFASNYSIIDRIGKMMDNETDPIKRIQYRQQLRVLLQKLEERKGKPA